MAQAVDAASRPASGEVPGVVPPDDELEATGAVIGTIVFERDNVFDTTRPGENKSLYRLANRLHFVTRQPVIHAQLLFRQGDVYSRRLLDESERILRRNGYLYDAKITPVRYRNGVVDVHVWTRDVWTLMPGFSVSRSGGENRTKVSLTENNLAGMGTRLRFSYSDDVDRESTGFEFADNHLVKSWWSVYLGLTDSSDGSTEQLRVIRPFYALDTHWSAGLTLLDDDREDRFYELGEETAEYRHETERYTVFGGLSSGLDNGWVRRWTAGLVYDDNRFSEVPDGTLPSLVPEDRHLVYPFIGFELLEDEFQTSSNRDQIGRTEDFYFGTRLTASVGYASTRFDADRNSLIVAAAVSKGFGSIEKKALLVSSALQGRVDEGDTANTLISASGRYYSQQSSKWLFYATLEGTWGKELDLDSLVVLGGEEGLRGYPLRYQTGDARMLVTVEERYFTDWYPFRLFRVGFAAFSDIGRTWGSNPAGGEPLGWLKDVGLGLRLAPTRASGRDIIHIDVAFPLDGDPSIDSVQFLIQSKRNF